MQVSKSLTPVLLFAILVHQIVSGPSDSAIIKSAAAESAAVASYAAAAPETANLKQLARNINMRHVRAINATDYYYVQQQSLIKALRDDI